MLSYTSFNRSSLTRPLKDSVKENIFNILIHSKNKYSEIVFGKNNILLFSTVDDAVQISRMLKSDPVKRLSLWKNQQKKVINNSTNPVKLLDKILT